MSEFIQDDNNQNVQEEQAPQQEPQQQEQPQSFLTWGEREFSSPDEVIKKFEHADTYIQELKQKTQTQEERLAELEAKLAQSTKIEDAMQYVQNQQQGQQAQGENTTQPQQNVEPQFDEKSFLDKVKQEIRNEQLQQEREANLRKIHEVSKAKYGNDYINKFMEKAKAEGLDFNDPNELKEFAMSRPKTFTKLFGLTSESKPSPAPTGGQRQTNETYNQAKSNSWHDIAAEVGKEFGVEYGQGFHKR